MTHGEVEIKYKDKDKMDFKGLLKAKCRTSKLSGYLSRCLPPFLKSIDFREGSHVKAIFNDEAVFCGEMKYFDDLYSIKGTYSDKNGQGCHIDSFDTGRINFTLIRGFYKDYQRERSYLYLKNESIEKNEPVFRVEFMSFPDPYIGTIRDTGDISVGYFKRDKKRYPIDNSKSAMEYTGRIQATFMGLEKAIFEGVWQRKTSK